MDFLRHIRKYLFELIILAIIAASIPVSLYLLSQPTSFFGRAFGKKANLVIDASVTADSSDGVWKNLAQGGEERGRMLEAVIDEVSTLEPNYIRIDHIYDFYDVVSRDDGNLVFNWTKLDETVDDILATGARPFFSLSYMPSVISSGTEVDIPNNWKDWEKIVEETIEHYSGSDNRAIENVYYEVWNEPDLFGDFKTRGKKNYLELYERSVAGANAASNTLSYKIGGPATTNFYKNWMSSLIKLSKNDGLRLDFLSWHLYSKDLGDFEKNARQAREFVKDSEVNENIELVVTETGFNSDVDLANDNVISAIHTIALNAIYEGEVDKVFAFEIKDGPQSEKTYWGRWGILTHEKHGDPIEKPRYNALEFLNNIKGDRLNVEGEGTWVKAFAKKEDRVLRLLIVNYDKKMEHYEAVPITINNLGTDSFILRRTNFLGGESERLITSDSAVSWTTTLDFEPNTASIFEIIPQ